jgi:hypothetical protein
MRTSVRVVPWVLLIVAGCSSGGTSVSGDVDAANGQTGNPPGSGHDAGHRDAGAKTDSGSKTGSGGQTDAGGKHDGGSAATCADLGCQAPATCDQSGAAPKCACPTGYTLAGGNHCDDVDECADSKLNKCDAHATCTNKKGGFDCACNGPVYTGDGKSCSCATGYSEVSGKCLADNGGSCSKDGDCGGAHCVSGICCASACDAPPGCKVAQGATCSGGEHCVYGTNASDGTSCDDGDHCTQSDSCHAGECTGTAVTCTASDQCHLAGTCDLSTGACSNPAATDGTTCSDGDACTPSDTCQSGQCTPGQAISCTASGPCHLAGTCNPSTGVCSDPLAQDGASCSDGNACTQTDTCQSGQCAPGQAITCTASDQCHDAGTCDTTTGQCSNPPKSGTPACNDGDACTLNDTCQNGTCTGSSSVVCTALDQCHGVGTCNSSTGVCSNPVSTGATCNDNVFCTVGETCNSSGQCTGGSANLCDDGNGCTTDTCDNTAGCLNQNNTATCSDNNPCTVGDVCAGGLCQPGSPKSCAGDACNDGTCNTSNGNCGLTPKAGSVSCNDNNSCTATDTCQNGTCTGSGNACGPNAAAGNSCTQGNPNTCTCLTGFHTSGGQCVPNVNECSPNPCVTSPVAPICNDPSSAAGDFTCPCPAGYDGDGKTAGTGCTLHDNCANNPCGSGRGTCVNGVNTHTCNCNTGYLSVNGVCVCDLNGAFAIQVITTESWSGISFTENATRVSSKAWSLRTQTYDSSGKLVANTEPCGGTSPDLCGTVDLPDGAPSGPEAYAVFTPNSIWGTASMPIWKFKDPPGFTITNPLPNQSYVEPLTAALMGISLTDPFGAWPAKTTNVGAGSSQTNGALWVDADNDGKSAVNFYAVPPNGVSTGTSPYFPPENFGATSTACPRSSSGARLPYNYLPVNSGGIQRVKRFSNAGRVISGMSGTLSSCDLITGNIVGPNNGPEQLDGLVANCVLVSGMGEAACSTPFVDNNFNVAAQGTHTLNSVTFIMKRVAQNTTCDQVRAMTFP